MPPNMSIMQAISNALYNAAKHARTYTRILSFIFILNSDIPLSMSFMQGYL
jgi:hypothetical protein